MKLANDYNERVYAGVLGKIIGVYLGRPFEGWTYDRIIHELGEIDYYVHDRLNKPLIVPDDDITGTFTFVRALADHGGSAGIGADQIGDTWLNYIIQNRSILWWGGMGNSTEHTAYLRLKKGLRAPATGSIAKNGKVVAEQIGAQIFIDGWAMVAPGDPELAADLARRAGSVSHDGEAIYGAQVIAAMEAMAFVEPDLSRLQDEALRLIPADSIIYQLIKDLREWHAKYPDWKDTRGLIEKKYGYDRYGGNCHMVPNHALIHLGLLYGNDNFQRSLMITNTSGWDTDCNSANVGCLIGIKNGLRCINEDRDWRGPVADRIYLPTSDGGRAISDAAHEAVALINIHNQMTNQPAWHPKDNARFSFIFPGSFQGFQILEAGDAKAHLSNPNGNGLRMDISGLIAGQCLHIATPTFIPLEAENQGTYSLMASPTIHSGQTIKAHISVSGNQPASINLALMLDYYDVDDNPVRMVSPACGLKSEDIICLEWDVPDTSGLSIFQVGLQVNSSDSEFEGQIEVLDYDWQGEPNITLSPKNGTGRFWHRSWVDATSSFQPRYTGELRVIQDEGSGMLIYGCQEWKNITVEAILSPHMLEDFGLALHVQGLRRYIGLKIDGTGQIELIRMFDSNIQVLGQSSCLLEYDTDYILRLEARGTKIKAFLNGKLIAEADDLQLTSGAVALLVTEGRLAAKQVRITPSQ